jgi:signal transduction histidine kinase
VRTTYSPDVDRPSTKLELRTLLIISIGGLLAVWMVLVTGTWILSSRNAAGRTAVQVAEEIAASTTDDLEHTLALPHRLNRANVDLIEAGLLTVDDPLVLERHFHRQLKNWELPSYIQYGAADGRFVGVERGGRGYVAETTLPDGSGKGLYRLDEGGAREAEPFGVVRGYDARTRPWFMAAKDAGGPAWSKVYQYSSRESVRLGVTAVTPVYSGDDLLGVVGTDITLTHLSDHIQTRRLAEQGRVYIVGTDGLLVASTHSAVSDVQPDKTATRIRAADASDPWVRLAAAQVGDAGWIEVEGDRGYVRKRKVITDHGLDWTMVVIVPESQLLADAADGIRKASYISLLFIIVGAAFAVVIAARINEPIRQLADLAAHLDEGVELPKMPTAQTREVAGLQAAFTRMRARLVAKEAVLKQTIETRTEALEAAQAADRAKSAFLARMSHELRTPLNAILGYGEILRDEVDPSLTGDVERIVFSGEELLRMIEQVLDLARFESGGITLTLDEMTLTPIIQRTADLARPLVEGSGNTLHIEVGDLHPVVTDELRVEQVLLHLLSNAASFTRDGHVTVRAQNENDGVAVVVQDTGKGIAPEHLEQVFEAFENMGNIDSGVQSGSGLGLTVSRRIARALGGELTATSELGRGSAFRLWLPHGGPFSAIDEA